MTSVSEGAASDAASAIAADKPPHKHAKSTKFFYALGAIAFGVKDNGFGAFLLLYYNQVLGLPAKMAGLAVMIALFVDAFIDPAIGYASDNLRTRWGRRHPFMYAAAVPTAVFYALLWNPPELSQTGLFFYLLFGTILIRALISCYEIPSTALAAELTQDYDERTSFLALRVFCGGMGRLAVSLLALNFFLVPTAEQPVGQLNENGYHLYGIAAAVIMFVAIMVSAIGTHRAIPGLMAAPPKVKRSLREVFGVVGMTLGNRSILVLLACGIVWAIAAGIVGALGFYINTYFWELSAQQISALALGAFGAYVIALVITPICAKRWGKKATALVGSVGYFILGPAPIWMRMAGFFPETGSPWLVPMLLVFELAQLAIGITAAMLVGSMMADVVEAAELKTGRRSEGLIFSANAFIAKSTSGVGLFVSGAVLAFVNFPEHAQPGKVDADVLFKLAMTYSVSVISLYIVALILLSQYGISRTSHNETLAALGRRAAEAK
jgi:Na+/melibiose symporter-like transporter